MVPISHLVFIFFACTVGVFFILTSIEKYRKYSQLITKGLPTQKNKLLYLIKPIIMDVTGFLKQLPSMPSLLMEQNRKYEKNLIKAGNPGMITGADIFASKLLLPVIVLFLALILVENNNFLIVILCMGISFIIPDLLLKSAAKNRIEAINETFPDAIDNFALLMDAGLNITQALDNYVSDSEKSPLQEEFYIVRSEIRLGKPIEDSLNNMARRLEIDDITGFASTVSQSIRAGVSMSKFIQQQAQRIRDARFRIAEEQGQLAPLKLLVPLMLFVMPCVFMIIFGPLAIKYFTGGF